MVRLCLAEATFVQICICCGSFDALMQQVVTLRVERALRECLLRVKSCVKACRALKSHAGHHATVTFEKCKGVLSQRGRVHGAVCDAKGKDLYTLSGSMLSTVTATPRTRDAAAAVNGTVGESVVVFERPPDVAQAEAQFHMSQFAIALNDECGAPDAAPTDTRRRPDVRCLENAQYELATEEKVRLEDIQRTTAKELAAAGLEYTPRWFARSAAGGGHNSDRSVRKDGKESVWEWRDEYWQAKEAGKWQDVREIYVGGADPAELKALAASVHSGRGAKH